MDEPKDASAPWKQRSFAGLSVSAWGRPDDPDCCALQDSEFGLSLSADRWQVSRQVDLLSCSAMRCKFLKFVFDGPECSRSRVRRNLTNLLWASHECYMVCDL